MRNAPRFELQVAPTLTVPPEVRETVSRAFADAGVVFDWLPMPGDLTAEDAARKRIAQPSLDIVLSSETDSDPSDLVGSVRNELASALVRVRSDAPRPLPPGGLRPEAAYDEPRPACTSVDDEEAGVRSGPANL
jgi:hypothetical protein